MKRSQGLNRICMVIAILLSDAMCAVVGYEYCALQWGGRYGECSAPPSVAFLYAIPFAVGILLCMILLWIFHKKIDLNLFGKEGKSR